MFYGLIGYHFVRLRVFVHVHVPGQIKCVIQIVDLAPAPVDLLKYYA